MPNTDKTLVINKSSFLRQKVRRRSSLLLAETPLEITPQGWKEKEPRHRAN
jgi:hypothetical protein